MSNKKWDGLLNIETPAVESQPENIEHKVLTTVGKAFEELATKVSKLERAVQKMDDFLLQYFGGLDVDDSSSDEY